MRRVGWVLRIPFEEAPTLTDLRTLLQPDGDWQPAFQEWLEDEKESWMSDVFATFMKNAPNVKDFCDDNKHPEGLDEFDLWDDVGEKLREAMEKYAILYFNTDLPQVEYHFAEPERIEEWPEERVWMVYEKEEDSWAD
jgi:hypothetical protein